MLTYHKKNIYRESSEQDLKNIFAYAEGYKKFLDECKTEREAVEYLIAEAEKNGYTPYRLGEKLKAGEKKYYNNRNKNLYLMRIGTANPAEDGLRIMAAHIDSPRLDIKQNPLYEKASQAMFKTHYYGGIKKYQWTAIPLALHGKVILADGSSLNVKIGEEEDDPVFYVSDLLPHLAAKQNEKKLSEAIDGETLNVWIGSIPDKKTEKDPVKQYILKLLNEKYGMIEEDFLSADLCAVPAFKAKDIGFDRALIGGYGHDDRCCSYTEFTALMNLTDKKHTVFSILADKEEVGSDSVTGMSCDVMSDLLDALADSFGVSGAVMRANSMCLSADVSAAYDANFADVYDANNSAMLSSGVSVMKFTGAKGKSGSNDATVEFLGKIRRIFNDHNVAWQMGELGKVDAGGGGTVAKFIAKLNIDTIDVGIPVISMHSPYEVISKADLYDTAKAFEAFCKD